MKMFHSSTHIAVATVSACMLLLSANAEAKGYTAKSSAAKDNEQRINTRLSQIEEQQKTMQTAMATEFKKLRSELDGIKAQPVMKTGLTTAK